LGRRELVEDGQVVVDPFSIANNPLRMIDTQ